jgi:chromosomal replication initiation ATPase DnaA
MDGRGRSVAQVRVPNRFKLDWIRSQYAHRIEAMLTELAGKPVRLELALAARRRPPTRPLAANGPVAPPRCSTARRWHRPPACAVRRLQMPAEGPTGRRRWPLHLPPGVHQPQAEHRR